MCLAILWGWSLKELTTNVHHNIETTAIQINQDKKYKPSWHLHFQRSFILTSGLNPNCVQDFIL